MTTRKVVSLPRPKGTRKSTPRAQLVLTMHPRQLRELEARAKARSMPGIQVEIRFAHEVRSCAVGFEVFK